MLSLYFFAFVELGLLVKYYSAIGFRKIPLQYIGNPCAIIECYAQKKSHFSLLFSFKISEHFHVFFLKKFYAGSFKCVMQSIGFDMAFALYFIFVDFSFLVRFYFAINFPENIHHYIGSPCVIIGGYAQNRSHFYIGILLHDFSENSMLVVLNVSIDQ